MQNTTIRVNRLGRAEVLPWLALLIILGIMAAIIWGTLGLKTTTIYEDWITYDSFSRGISPLDFSIFGKIGRPFLGLNMGAGLVLTPNSFLGYNVYSIALFFLQGIALFALLWRLRPQNVLYALAAAVLVSIYPADNSLANLRYIGYHAAIILFLWSVYFLVAYWQRPRVVFIVGIIVANMLNLGMVEVSYPLVFITPLLLVWLNPSHRISPRVRRVALLWYTGLFIMLLLSLIIYFTHPGSYQAALLGTSQHEPLVTHLILTGDAIFHAYEHVLLSGWGNALQRVDYGSWRLLEGLVVALLFGGCAWLVIRNRTQPQADRQPSLVDWQPGTINDDRTWFVIGLFVIGFGFAIYSYLPTHRDYTERVFLFPIVGAAIIVPVIAMWVGRLLKKEVLFLILGIAILTGIGLQADLVDVERDVTASEQEQSFLAQIVEQTPNLDPARLVVIFDRTHQLSTSMIFAAASLPDVLQPALDYLYHTPDGFDVRVCTPDVDPSVSLKFGCVIGKDNIAFANAIDAPLQSYPLNQVVAYDYLPDNQLKLLDAWPVAGSITYRPTQNLNLHATPPKNTFSLFSRWPFVMQTPLNEHPFQSLYFDSNSVIRFIDEPLLPFINYGWVGNWTSSTHSTLDVWLSPDHDYQLMAVISHSTVAETLKHITLTVNDQPIPITMQANADQTVTLTASISQAAVARDLSQTRIAFLSYPLTSPLIAGTGPGSTFLGFEVDRFSVVAVNK